MVSLHLDQPRNPQHSFEQHRQVQVVSHLDLAQEEVAEEIAFLLLVAVAPSFQGRVQGHHHLAEHNVKHVQDMTDTSSEQLQLECHQVALEDN